MNYDYKKQNKTFFERILDKTRTLIKGEPSEVKLDFFTKNQIQMEA